MKNCTLKQYYWKLLTISILTAGLFSQPHAAPLAAGTLLGIEQGVGAGANVPCTNGSCFGMEVAPGYVIWTGFGAGTDGAIIVGKNQRASGQESSPSPYNNTSCQMTNAWNFFANFGCFYTPAGASENFFNDTSCTGAGCKGITQFGSLNVAWNGTSVPMGSTNGCNSSICSPEELAGDFITNYTIGSNGQPWSIHYHNVVPNGDPSSFGNVKFQFLARGVMAMPIPTLTPTPPPTPTPSPTPPCESAIPTGVGFYGITEVNTGIGWSVGIKYDGIYNISSVYCPGPPGISGPYTDDTGNGIIEGYGCSGTYTPYNDFIGNELFSVYIQFSISCGDGRYIHSSTGANVSIDVIPPSSPPTPAPSPTPAPTTCESLYPQTSVTMIGKGKNIEVEETMTTTFKGHIISTDEAKGKVTICRGTTVSYKVTSTVGTANCSVKHGVSAQSTGTLTDKGKLVCNNKPDGNDVDKFKIKRSKKDRTAIKRRWFK